MDEIKLESIEMLYDNKTEFAYMKRKIVVRWSNDRAYLIPVLSLSPEDVLDVIGVFSELIKSDMQDGNL